MTTTHERLDPNDPSVLYVKCVVADARCSADHPTRPGMRLVDVLAEVLAEVKESRRA